MLDGYDGALHLSLGRVIEVSVAAMRLILSGMMERHPKLKIVMSHTGGALPYQSGRMDKNTKAAKLPQPVSDLHEAHVHRHGVAALGRHEVRDRLLRHRQRDVRHRLSVLGSGDRACKLLDEIKLSDADKQKLFYDNARRILGLKDPAPAKRASASRRWREASQRRERRQAAQVAGEPRAHADLGRMH